MSRAANLRRLLAPTTVAVVGASETLGMSNNAVLPMLEAGRVVHLVNPNRDILYGQPVHPTLTAIGEPIDAVLSLVSAERSIGVVEEAAALGCGGVAVAAAGFTELGPDGAALQDRLCSAADAGELAIVGPNCSGLKNVPLGVNLFTGGRLDLAAGGVSVVSQSGFLVRAALAAAGERQLGVAIAVSSGNEAVCDLADHVDALTDDPHTTVICLVIEKIRRPDAFFSAVARARAAGKPVIALKLGRSARAQRIMASHTGAIAGDAWLYDVAFAEHGVIGARDIDDLLDRAQLLAQLPDRSPGRVRRIAVITTSGGVAALATDLAEDEGIELPELDELAPWVRERVPGDTVNPLDLTGFVMSQREVMEELFERYAEAVDALVLCWWLGAGDESWSRTVLEPFAAVACRVSTPMIVTPTESTGIGSWVPGWRDRGLVFARGVESTYRAIAAVDRFADPSVRAPAPPPPPAESARPALVPTPAGPIVGFADAMALLASVGVGAAPFAIIGAEESENAWRSRVERLGDRLVVKLAEVPHRTELGAVALGVAPADVADAVARMRAIALAERVPAAVVVQAMVNGHGEAFAGLLGTGELGPVVLLGRGGVLVEAGGRVAGRQLPLDAAAAAALAAQVTSVQLRGHRAWNPEPLAAVCLGLGELWARHGSWLASVDLNPLVLTDAGVVAVDALFVAL